MATRVDTARRAFPIYQQIRDYFADDPIVHMDVRGGDWGLACNAIHFLDLLSFLAGGLPEAVETALLSRRADPQQAARVLRVRGDADRSRR